METQLAKIAQVAKENLNEIFTSLMHLINESSLTQCHYEMKANKASGVDTVTKEEYQENLDSNIKELIAKMKRQAYKPQPVRRVYISKEGSDKLRPLGIPSYEDKIVQKAVSKILNAIYEQDFLECSFGFRPKRGCHDALKTISSIIESRPVHYIVDADIRGFYDHLNHTWLMKFLKHRIADENLLRLIGRFLKSGVIENQEYHPTIEGAPQGGVVSPILANVYLHYILDLWFSKVVKAHCRGEAHMVRYADDFICCFQYEEDAKRYYRALQNRLGKFGLDLADDKTKIIAFGKDSLHVKNKGQIKPGTFDFVGFSHYCGKSKMGRFRVKRKTSKKKYRTSLLKVKKWVKENRNLPSQELMNALRVKLNGYFRYYGVTDNFSSLGKFLQEVTKLLYNWLNRRSQRKSFTREQFVGFLQRNPLPSPKIYVNIFQLRFPITWCQ